MKRKILSLILVFAMTVSLLTVGTGAVEPTYGDTAGHWAESSIERWSGHGIIQGSNGLFDPNGQLTCAQLATILAKLLKLPAAKDAGFTDNTADAWYYDAINRCAAAGILNGNGDGTVTPDAPISRERAMVMLARALGIEPIRKPDLTKYTDAAQVSAYAQGYVAALIEAGIVGGVTADELAPQNNITRAATVTILDRAIGTYADKAGATVKADGKGIVLVVADDVTVTGSVDKLLVPANDIEVTVKGSKNIDDITVSGDNSKVILDNASADNVTLDGEKSAVETKNGAKIDNVIVTENAPGATVDVGSGTTVGNVENHAEDATVTGNGTVKKVESDKDITVETKNTDVKNIGDEKITVTDKRGKDTTIGTTGSGSSTTVNKGTTSSGGGGGSYTPPAQHTHAWATAWSYDETHHWHDCMTAGCPLGNEGKDGYAAHTFTNGVCVCSVKSPEVKATENAWDALNAKLKEIKGTNDAALVTAARNGTAYTLLLDVDAIQSGAEAFDDNFLTGLATNLKTALDDNFGSYVLTADGQDVYNKGTFQNTALKKALFSVADGFFYTLSNMNGADGVYTYKTVNAKVTGTNTYSFTIAVQLKGEDVSKVKSLAGTLADHLQMEMLDSNAIQNRYGISVNEEKAVVVTMEMPDKLMRTAVGMLEGKDISAADAQVKFDNVPVSTFLNLMQSVSLENIIGSNASDVNSVLTTVNSNANVVNKILSKMTAKVTAKDRTEANFVMTFTPGNEDNAWEKFLAGVIGMVGDGENSVGAMKPNQFKVAAEGTYKDVYYAVPVTIDLESSMGFQATETVVVVMHIDFSQYVPSNTQGQSAQSGNDLSESNAPKAEVEVNVNAVANPVAEDSDVENSVEDLAK